MSSAPVLLVDDEPALRASLKEALQADGYQVQDAGDVSQALALMADRHYPVVLTDLNMADGPTGFDLIAAVKARDPNTLCVVFTGYASLETAVQAVKYGAYDFVQKPFRLAEIEAVLDRALDHAAVLDQLGDYQGNLEQRVLDRVRDLALLQEEVLQLSDVLVDAQAESAAAPVLERFLAHLRARMPLEDCLALDADGGRYPIGGAQEPLSPLPDPARLDEAGTWDWPGRPDPAWLVPLRGAGRSLGALALAFPGGFPFNPEEPAFVLWRRQLEAALLGLERTRERLAADRAGR
jgi:ActR/RegA family two-component response regulator